MFIRRPHPSRDRWVPARAEGSATTELDASKRWVHSKALVLGMARVQGQRAGVLVFTWLPTLLNSPPEPPSNELHFFHDTETEGRINCRLPKLIATIGDHQELPRAHWR